MELEVLGIFFDFIGEIQQSDNMHALWGCDITNTIRDGDSTEDSLWWKFASLKLHFMQHVSVDNVITFWS